MTNTTDQQTKRKYIPAIGSRVRMHFMNDYTSRGIEAWGVLICTGVDGDNVTCQRTSTANGTHDGKLVTIPLNLVESPGGWRERYTIHARPDKVADVLSWMSRGIVVRFSQYIGDGSTAFQPMDNSGQPHWKFGEVTDTIPPGQTRELIQVVKLETESAFLPCDCRYCNGTGTHTTNLSLASQSIAESKCPKCGVHTGFSFTEPWHDTASQYLAPTQFCSKVRKAGECWCCEGSGQGAKYISELDKKERKVAIATLARDGWKCWYEKHGQCWMMERETVVKDFGVDVEVTA